MTLSGGMFQLLKEDHARRWRQPLSWWNLAALIPVLLLLIFSVHSWWSDAQIAKRQQTAIATIDGHDPPNHNRYHYTFSVNGNQFAGWASPGNREFSIGQHIVVYYDPLQPSESSAYDFNEINPGGVVFIAFLFMGCALFPAYIYFQRRSRKNAA